MSAVPGKLFAKSCTKMSLNERFTVYRSQAQAASTTFRDKLIQQRQASAENRRLAQQMANRPSVIAALKLKKRSMVQRLGQKRNTLGGGNIQSRLNFNLRQAPKVQSRLGLRGRGRGASRFPRRGGGGNRGNKPGFASGTSPMIKARLGLMNTRKFSSRGGFARNKRFGRQNVSPRFQRGGRGRGRVQSARGSRGVWNRIRPMPSKQDLDNELDEYMSETKTSYT